MSILTKPYVLWASVILWVLSILVVFITQGNDFANAVVLVLSIWLMYLGWSWNKKQKGMSEEMMSLEVNDILIQIKMAAVLGTNTKTREKVASRKFSIRVNDYTSDVQKINTEKFTTALKTAKNINEERFCRLFQGDSFSFQVFENPNIKQLVCETCFN